MAITIDAILLYTLFSLENCSVSKLSFAPSNYFNIISKFGGKEKVGKCCLLVA